MFDIGDEVIHILDSKGKIGVIIGKDLDKTYPYLVDWGNDSWSSEHDEKYIRLEGCSQDFRDKIKDRLGEQQ